MFKDEPLNLNQARTNHDYEQKIIFLYITNTGRLIQEIDDNEVGTVIDHFLSFLIALGYGESLLWDTLAEKVTTKEAFETLREQFRDFDSSEK